MPILAAYGHSWIQGDGATSPANRLVNVAARTLGHRACNLGVGGSLSVETAALVSWQAPRPAEMYLLMTGLNDARLHGESQADLREYTAALALIFKAFRAASSDAIVIAVEQPHLLDYSLHGPHDRGSSKVVDWYNTRLRQVARDFGLVVVAVTGWDPGSMLAADTVHPNDAGHAQIGRTVADAYRAAESPMASTRPVHD